MYYSNLTYTLVCITPGTLTNTLNHLVQILRKHIRPDFIYFEMYTFKTLFHGFIPRLQQHVLRIMFKMVKTLP